RRKPAPQPLSTPAVSSGKLPSTSKASLVSAADGVVSEHSTNITANTSQPARRPPRALSGLRPTTERETNSMGANQGKQHTGCCPGRQMFGLASIVAFCDRAACDSAASCHVCSTQPRRTDSRHAHCLNRAHEFRDLAPPAALLACQQCWCAGDEWLLRPRH